MKTLKTFLLAVSAVSLMLSCQKNNTKPLVPPKQRPVTVNSYGLDTAITGHYNMISCSDASEGANVVLIVRYVSIMAVDGDTLYTYRIVGNTSVPGEVRISKSWTYYDDGVNHMEPRFNEKNGKITDGFIGDGDVMMMGSENRRSGDTLIFNFTVFPKDQGQKLLTCRYLKT